MNTNKFWDSMALIIILLASLMVIASLTQLLFGGAIPETFNLLTLKVINILFGLSVVLIVIIVVMEKGFQTTTMAWIMVLIGTANIDLWSFNQNLELTATVYDAAICNQAAAACEHDLINSARLDPDQFATRRVIKKSEESLCRLFSPLS